LDISEAWFVLPLPVGMGAIAIYAIANVFRQDLRSIGYAVGFLLAVSLLNVFLIQGAQLSIDAVLVVSVVDFALLLFLRVPVAFSFLGATLVYIGPSHLSQLNIIPITMQQSLTDFLLLAVPLFILAGTVMTEGGISDPIAEWIRSMVGHVRGGLYFVIVIVMYVFSGISGVKVADVAAVGQTMRTMTRKEGYPDSGTAAVVAASAAMGETVPPSVAMLILASVTTVSVGSLFAAGLVPSLLIAILLIAFIAVRARRENLPRSQRARPKQMARGALIALPGLVVPVILLGGILGGIATPTESSAVAVVYGVLVSIIVYRRLPFRRIWPLLVESAGMTGVLMLIVSSAASFSWTLTFAGFPEELGRSIMSLPGGQPVFLLGTILVMIVLGSFLEGTPALIVLGPLLLPLATEMGVNSIHYGIIMIVAMGIGFFSPPLGIGLHVSCAVTGTRVSEAISPMFPLLVILLIGVIVIAYVPWFTLVVPRLLGLGT
jgi:tripartite ATP-independent transporter DctM subunit